MINYYSVKDNSSCVGRKVSVITRTKNRPILLVRAMASVLSQTHQDWEHIIVNDGGDADTLNQLIEEYRPAYGGRLKLFHNAESLGMEAASNVGLQNSEGDYIVIHDDDDAWHPSFMGRCLAYLEDSKNASAVAVAANCVLVKEYIDGDFVVEVGREDWGFWKNSISAGSMFHTNSIPPIGLLIRRSTVNNIGNFNNDLPVLGDWDYNIRLLSVGDIGSINEKLAYYCHRVSANAEDNVYGNTVSLGNSRHEKYRSMYLNGLMRELISKNPGYIALISTLMEQNYELNRNLHKHLDFLHEKNYELNRNLHKHLDFLHEQNYELNRNLHKHLDFLHEQNCELNRNLHKHLDFLHDRLLADATEKPQSIIYKYFNRLFKIFRA